MDSDTVSVRTRLDERARAWGVAIERTLETESSLIGFGEREHQPVVLKVVKRPGDEWTSGEGFAQAVLSAIWSVEDGFSVDARHPVLGLANVIRAMLPPYS